MNKYKYSLQKYQGSATRHECPRCGDKHSFVLYVDETNNPISPMVGRCNHECSCGYHMTPSDYFKLHPTERFNTQSYLRRRFCASKPEVKPICYISSQFVSKSLSMNSDFIHFLAGIVDAPTIEAVINHYMIGATKAGDIIYWQIDKNLLVRSGKIMRYNPETGHRVKDGGQNFNWVHTILQKQGQLPQDWQLSQCLFGEHLLKCESADKTIAIVESEKTAILGSICFPNFIWMATGGLSNLNEKKLTPLKGRKILLFPDAGAYSKWKEKADLMKGLNISVSNIIEEYASDDEKERLIDVGDWFVECLQQRKECA